MNHSTCPQEAYKLKGKTFQQAINVQIDVGCGSYEIFITLWKLGAPISTSVDHGAFPKDGSL